MKGEDIHHYSEALFDLPEPVGSQEKHGELRSIAKNYICDGEAGAKLAAMTGN